MSRTVVQRGSACPSSIRARLLVVSFASWARCSRVIPRDRDVRRCPHPVAGRGAVVRALTRQFGHVFLEEGVDLFGAWLGDFGGEALDFIRGVGVLDFVAGRFTWHRWWFSFVEVALLRRRKFKPVRGRRRGTPRTGCGPARAGAAPSRQAGAVPAAGWSALEGGELGSLTLRGRVLTDDWCERDARAQCGQLPLLPSPRRVVEKRRPT